MIYSINCTDSETPYRWMDLADSYRPGAQDSGRCRFDDVVVSTRNVAAFEAALEADPLVLTYDEETETTDDVGPHYYAADAARDRQIDRDLTRGDS